MTTQVVNIKGMRTNDYNAYIGRKDWCPAAYRGLGADGFYGNTHGRGGLREYAAEWANRVQTNADDYAAVVALQGRTLGCFCKPEACHGDILVAIIQALTQRATPITDFRGNYRWLSNFGAVPGGVRLPADPNVYPTTEHAYQAAKTTDIAARRGTVALSCREVKRWGNDVDLRDDWDAVRIGVMRHVNEQKFAPGTNLADKLFATGLSRLEEGNNWGDTFWGVTVDGGYNHLGRTLMAIRFNLTVGRT